MMIAPNLDAQENLSKISSVYRQNQGNFEKLILKGSMYCNKEQLF